jgi:hypothetical protein
MSTPGSITPALTSALRTVLQQCVADSMCFDEALHGAMKLAQVPESHRVSHEQFMALYYGASGHDNSPVPPTIKRLAEDAYQVYLQLHQDLDKAENKALVAIQQYNTGIQNTRPVLRYETYYHTVRIRNEFTQMRHDVNNRMLRAGTLAATGGPSPAPPGPSIESITLRRKLKTSSASVSDSKLTARSVTKALTADASPTSAMSNGATVRDDGWDSNNEHASSATTMGEPNSLTSMTGRTRRSARNVSKATTKKRPSKRATLPKTAVAIMRKWLFDHFERPYPTEVEKVLYTIYMVLFAVVCYHLLPFAAVQCSVV